MIAYITELVDENYESFKKDGLVLVDVKAEWCGPCKVLSPIIDQISTDYQGRVKVGKLDADLNKHLVMEMGIRSIPTIVIYKDGVEVDRRVGMVTKQIISELLETHLN